MHHRAYVLCAMTAACLTLAMVVGLGWWVDPFAHFTPPGQTFDRTPAYTLNRSLFKLIDFRKTLAGMPRGQELRVIVGDSTANQIDPVLVSARQGRRWYNLAYGGATLPENIKLVAALLEQPRVREIVWSVSFMRVRADVKDEMARSMTMAERPFLHLLSFESLRGVFYVLRRAWLGVGLEDPDFTLTINGKDADGGWRLAMEYRDLVWPAAMLAEIDHLRDRATARGVGLALVLAPSHPTVRQVVRNALPERYARYLAFLETQCVIDLDTARPGGWPPATFADTAHLRKELLRELAHLFSDAVAKGCGRNRPPLVARVATGPRRPGPPVSGPD